MLTHKGTQTIKTQRLVLRRFTLDDAQMMYDNWAKDERVTKYLMWEAHDSVEVTFGILEQWLEKYKTDDYYHWAIVFEGEPVGTIGVVEISDRDSNGVIGYCIGFDYWRKGIVTEALNAVLGFMFDEVNMHRLCAYHDVDNTGSGKVMVKAGMTLEGLLREAMLRRDGSYGDIQLLGIVRGDWENQRNKA